MTAVTDNFMEVVGHGLFTDFFNRSINLFAVTPALLQLHTPLFMNILRYGSGCNAKFLCCLRLGHTGLHKLNGKISPDLRKIVPYSFFTGKYHDNTLLELKGIGFRVFKK
jgi:hypothetical protein